MKILIVDDSDYKIQGLREMLDSMDLGGDCVVAKSFHGAIREFERFVPDLVLLDMTLPTSERSDGQVGGRDRLYGGKELLGEMEFMELDTKVILVSQFDKFGETPNSVDLQTLARRLEKRFPSLLIGSVFFDNVGGGWKDELREILTQFI